MALIKEYKNKLIEPCPSDYGYGYVNLNEDIKNLIIENVFECSFNCLYARLLINMYDDRLLDSLNIDNSIIEKVRWFIDNRHVLRFSTNYTDYKVWINSLYNKELRTCAVYLINLYGQYMSMYYDDIIKQNKYNWLYIDTDVMYFTGGDPGHFVHPDMHKLFENETAQIDIENIDYISFFGKKKYVKYSKGEIKTKGIQANKQQDVINIIKTKIRERRIDEVLK